MPALDIRLARRADAPVIAALIHATDRHYNPPAEVMPVEPTRAMVERLFDTSEGTRFALAFDDGVPVGIAGFVIVRPGARLKGQIFLKDLFVVEEARDGGVGKALLRFLMAYGRERGLGRIDLTTGTENRAAQRFYERLGGEKQDKVFYRFEL